MWSFIKTVWRTKELLWQNYFSFWTPPSILLHQRFRAETLLFTAPAVSPRIFTDVIWVGNSRSISYDSFCCFWMASTRPKCQVTHTHKKMSSRSSWLLGRCIIIAALKLPMGLSRFRYQETILAFFVLYRCHFLLNILWFLEFLMLCISSYFVNRGSKVTFLCRKQDSL